MARSKEIVPGVGRFSRSQVAHRRGLWKGPKKSEKAAAEETAPHVEKQVVGEKNGGKRLVPTAKAPRFYPAEDVRQPKKSRKSPKPASLRSTITPGTVLILLAGRFRGKRVVFLQQLASGLLLVTGPFKVNGVPLRRVNQAYVIATSTKVELGDFKVRHNSDMFSQRILQLTPLPFLSSTRKSTTLISQKPHPRAHVRLRPSSSKRASPKRSSPCPNPRLPTRRRSTRLSLPPSRRLKILANTSRPRGVCRRVSSLTSWSSRCTLVGCVTILG